MREVRIDSESSNEVVTFEDIKAWGKIPGTADDGLITQLIKSCRQLQEQWTGRSYIGKTLTVQWDSLESYLIDLPYGPIRTITSLKWVYSDGSLSAAMVDGTDYHLSGLDFKKINLYKRYSSSGGLSLVGLRAVYTCGHGDAVGQVKLPAPLRETVMRQVITDYDMRDDLEQSQAVLYDWVKEALAPYRLETWL